VLGARERVGDARDGVDRAQGHHVAHFFFFFLKKPEGFAF
jgi:hypothetical protein